MNSHNSYIGKLIGLPVFIGVLIILSYVISNMGDRRYVIASLGTAFVLALYYYYMVKEHRKIKAERQEKRK